MIVGHVLVTAQLAAASIDTVLLAYGDRLGGCRGVIPELDATTGQLPVGRYLATLHELRDRFVTHPQFEDSTTRPAVWKGFARYLSSWRELERQANRQLLLSVWIAGSFTSAKKNPSDIDITPVIDHEAFRTLGKLKLARPARKLVQHRQSIVDQFRVEPFPLRWVATAASLHPQSVNSSERDYLLTRGARDDWWQRCRGGLEDGPPRAEDAHPRRGYLEVTRGQA